MNQIQIKENLDYTDFLEANFPQVLAPLYKKRLFIINIAFGLLFTIATIYLYIQSFKNGIRFESVHYMYLFFAVLFTFLAFYLVKREKKMYRKIVDEINGLKTVYIIDDQNIQVQNNQVNLTYHKKDLLQTTDLPKWLVFEFKNGERVVVYKPNISEKDLKVILEIYQTNQ